MAAVPDLTGLGIELKIFRADNDEFDFMAKKKIFTDAKNCKGLTKSQAPNTSNNIFIS